MKKLKSYQFPTRKSLCLVYINIKRERTVFKRAREKNFSRLDSICNQVILILVTEIYLLWCSCDAGKSRINSCSGLEETAAGEALTGD